MDLSDRKKQIIDRMFYEYETGVRSDTCNEWVYNTIIAKNHSIELLLG